jgi:ABC-2 type transport system ATP-binding protein
MDAIATQNLTKTYRSLGKRTVRSLRSLDLNVAEEEVFGFLGRNGAGKTTTIKVLCSLLKPTRGKAEIFGQDARRREARAHIGYLPENPYFYEYLTPKETIDFYGKLQGLDPAARAAEWKRLAELLDLEPIGHQRVRGFSKGMRQRLGFAVALVGDPKLLILDEPMSGLDPLGRRMMRELILHLRDQRKTIFFSSHVLGDVEQICDRVGILVAGQMKVSGRITELLERRVERVDVLARGLKPETVAEAIRIAGQAREGDDELRFETSSIEQANKLVKLVTDTGGTLVEVTPVKESLEEYFMREQETVT